MNAANAFVCIIVMPSLHLFNARMPFIDLIIAKLR